MSMSTTVQAEGFDAFAESIVRDLTAGQDGRRSELRSGPSPVRRAEAPWLVIASRPDPQDAVSLAESYGSTLGAMGVIQSRNGHYAIVAGTLNRDKAKPNLEALKALRLVPQDSILSDGKNYQRVIWHTFDGARSLDLMARPTYQQSVRRLQAAFSRLGLYAGPVDGLIGPTTGVAFRAYVEKYGATFGEVVDTYALVRIEDTATDGFRNGEERSLARARGFQDAATFEEAEAGGFPSASAYSEARSLGFRSQQDWDQALSGGFHRADDYVRAKAGGFGNASAYREAQRDGFETAREHGAFQASGFSDAQTFRIAQRDGFADKASWQKAQAEKLKLAQREARDLLSDADAFVRLNPQTPNLLEIAAEAATLKGGLASASATDLSATALRLRAALSQASGFAPFETARREERGREAEARRATLRGELEATRIELGAWVAANLTSPKLPGIVAELKLLTEDAKSDDLDRLEAARERASSVVGREGLAGEIALLTRRPAETAQAVSGGLPQSVAITPANRVLLEGSPDEIVVLYNAGPRAPALTRNLVGAFAFRTGRASLCMSGVATTPALRRALAEELLRFDGRDVALSGPDCGPMDLSNSDLLLIQRRAFLASSPAVAVPFLDALEAGSLRVFEDMPFTKLTKRMDAETALGETIKSDIAAGRRNGYGALLLAKGKGPICAVLDEEVEAHRDMLTRVARYAESETGRAPTTRLASLDDAFLAARAEECRLVYGSEQSLKRLAEGLERDGRAATFVPIWLERKDLDGAVAALASAREAALQATEARRVAAEGERSVAERAAIEAAQTREARQAALRARYGAEAAALANRFSDGFKGRVLGQDGGVQGGDTAMAVTLAGLFPQFEAWRGALPADDWKPIAVDLAIADYGTAQWKERSLEAIAMTAKVQIVSRLRGEYKEHCFLFATVVDGEFSMYRDAFEASCETGEATLDRWKTGHRLESRWLAP